MQRLSSGTLLLLVGLSLPAAAADLIDVTKAAPGIKIEMRYAAADNFLHQKLYDAAVALLRPPVAERLARVQAALEKQGLGLKIWDAYRPASVQRKMWALEPDERFVANPAKGSVHSRGAAVDVTLVTLRDGKELDLGTPHDEFSSRAFPDSRDISAAARANRRTLKAAMEAQGFRQLKTEWWHFNGPDGERYPILDVPLSGAAGGRQGPR